MHRFADRAVAERIVRQTHKAFSGLGLLDEPGEPDAMDELFRESLEAEGSRHGAHPARHSRLSANVAGFSLQAGTRIHPNDRTGLENLCRYCARPPIAASRLTKLEDGRYRYDLRYPLPDGRTCLTLTGQQAMARLALLVPMTFA